MNKGQKQLNSQTSATSSAQAQQPYQFQTQQNQNSNAFQSKLSQAASISSEQTLSVQQSNTPRNLAKQSQPNSILGNSSQQTLQTHLLNIQRDTMFKNEETKQNSSDSKLISQPQIKTNQVQNGKKGAQLNVQNSSAQSKNQASNQNQQKQITGKFVQKQESIQQINSSQSAQSQSYQKNKQQQQNEQSTINSNQLENIQNIDIQNNQQFNFQNSEQSISKMQNIIINNKSSVQKNKISQEVLNSKIKFKQKPQKKENILNSKQAFQNPNAEEIKNDQKQKQLRSELSCLQGDEKVEEKTRKESLDEQDQFDDRLFNQIERLLHDEYAFSCYQKTNDQPVILSNDLQLSLDHQIFSSQLEQQPNHQQIQGNSQLADQNILNKESNLDQNKQIQQIKKKVKSKVYKTESHQNYKLRSRTETPSKAFNLENILNEELMDEIKMDLQQQLMVDSSLQDYAQQNQDKQNTPIKNLNQKDEYINFEQVISQNDQSKHQNQTIFNQLRANKNNSPSKLLQKHLERQQKAQMLRSQIVQNKKNQLQKIRTRQQDMKSRFNLIQEEKRTKLNDKLEHARENRNIEITNIKQKAQQEIQCVEEIKYIKYLTQNNMQLDIINKLTETKERRDQYQQEIKKKLDEQKVKEEEASKRRKEMYKIRIEELRKNELKKKEAYQRQINLFKQKLLQQKQKNEQKQAQVLQRKNIMGEKVNDVIKFVGDQENIWELIGIEESFYQKGSIQEIDIFKMGLTKKNDLLNLEKQQLKKDAQFLDKILSFSKEGKIQVKIEPDDLGQFYKLLKGNEFFDNSSSSSSKKYQGEQSDDADMKSRQSNISSNKVQYKFFKNTGENNHTNKSASSNNNVLENTSPQQYLNSKEFKSNVQRKIFQEKDCKEEDNEYPDKQCSDNGNIDDLNGNFNDQLQMDLNKQNNENMTTERNKINSDLLLNIKSDQQSNFINDEFIGKSNQQYATLNQANLLKLENRNSDFNLKNKTDSGTLSFQGYQNSKKNEQKTINQFLCQPLITDEEEQLMLIEGRIYQSIKRNVLRETMSEDLEWALCIKNDNEDFFDKIRQYNAQNFNQYETKSLQSTPDKNRKQITEVLNQRDKSCDDRIFGSASSHTKKFKRTSRLNSRRSSISSTIKYTLHKSKSKDIIIHGQSNSQADQRSFKFLNNPGEIQNAKNKQKRDNSRDSYESHRILGRSSLGQLIQPKNLFHHHSSLSNVCFQQSEDLLRFNNEDASNNVQQQQKNNFGFQMNQLITNMKPILSFSQSKILPKLSTNAQKYLFPIREQMILFKRPGIDGQFVDARVALKLEDVQQIIKNQNLNIMNSNDALTLQTQSAIKSLNLKTGEILITQSQGEDVQTEEKAEIKQENNTPNKKQINENQNIQMNNMQQQITPMSIINSQKSTNNHSPINEIPQSQAQTNIESKIEILNQNLPGQLQQEDQQQLKESAVRFLLKGQFNDLLKNEETQKSIELSSEDQQEVKDILHFLDRLENEKLSFRYCRLCEAILTQEIQVISEKILTSQSDQILPIQNEDQENNLLAQNKYNENNLQHNAVEEQVNLNIHQQSTVFQNNMTQHILTNKQHRKIRDDLGIKEIEDQCFSILNFQSAPGDISKELLKEKEKALKRKVKKLKLQLQQMAVSHDNAGCQQAWKDYSSLNKKTLQIRCLDLEKQVNPVIRDYDALEINLKEIIKLLQIKNQGDLMLFRKLKFIPTLVDICKRILICPKQEVKYLGKAIELSIKIISVFCSIRENRNYMIQTNRIMPLVDLLHWCMNRQTQFFYGISFLPQLFQLITMHIKHRCPYECIQSKEYLIEILICSSLQNRIKSKLAIINYPLAIDRSQMQGQVPLFLLKSVTFIEALTSIVSSDAKYRPIYERNSKLGEHYLFVIENTEFFGVIQMIATLLLTHSEQFKTSHYNVLTSQADCNDKITKLMPQTFLSISIVSIKVLNNIIRMDQIFVQNLLSKNEILMDQLYHLLNYLLVYSNENYEQNEDTKELLHESILFIGYLSMENEKTQQILTRGENTILQKLCNLPFPYFSDKKLKEILYPTLIQASYKSERCLAIMNQEISFDPIIKFLKDNMKEELPRIMEEEFDHQSMSSLGDIGGRLGAVKARKREGRNPSRSSTNSSGCSTQMESISNGNCPYLPLFMRFPKSKWQDAIEFYEKINE